MREAPPRRGDEDGTQMTKASLPARLWAVAALGVAALSTGTADAAAPGPAPGLTQAGLAAVPVRMKRPVARRGGSRTISTKLGTKTR